MTPVILHKANNVTIQLKTGLKVKRSQNKMANRNFLEENLTRLNQELTNHKRNLSLPGLAEEERMNLLRAVRDVEREILSTLRELRDLTELENSRMLRAIIEIEKIKKK